MVAYRAKTRVRATEIPGAEWQPMRDLTGPATTLVRRQY